MPLIEIINITLLAFSVGILALMGISYLVYRYRETSQKELTKNPIKQEKVDLIPKEIKAHEKPVRTYTVTNKIISKYQIIRTYDPSVPTGKNPNHITEKFLVVNNISASSKKTHSPKFIYLVSSTSNR